MMSYNNKGIGSGIQKRNGNRRIKLNVKVQSLSTIKFYLAIKVLKVDSVFMPAVNILGRN